MGTEVQTGKLCEESKQRIKFSLPDVSYAEEIIINRSPINGQKFPSVLISQASKASRFLDISRCWVLFIWLLSVLFNYTSKIAKLRRNKFIYI
ncbi:hypothetical protein SCA6_002764 [Theobroma cacao]